MIERLRQRVLPLFLAGAIALLGAQAQDSPPLGALTQGGQLERLNQQLLDLYRSGQYAEGIPVAAEAVRLAESSFGAQHARVAESLNNLAEMYRLLGRFAEAKPLYERSLRIAEIASGPESPRGPSPPARRAWR